MPKNGLMWTCGDGKGWGGSPASLCVQVLLKIFVQLKSLFPKVCIQTGGKPKEARSRPGFAAEGRWLQFIKAKRKGCSAAALCLRWRWLPGVWGFE